MHKLPLRRTPLYRLHEQQHATFLKRNGGQVNDQYIDDLQAEREQAKSLAITDLTALNRIGFKGAGSRAWLEAQAILLPESPNTLLTGEDETLVAALSNSEFLILDGLKSDGGVIPNLRAQWSMDIDESSYLLERADSHACFAVSGSDAAELFSKVCAVDMRLHKFANHQLAQTSVARSNAIVLRSDLGETPCFYVLADISASEFLWHGLLDAMQEFNGKPVGLSAIS